MEKLTRSFLAVLLTSLQAGAALAAATPITSDIALKSAPFVDQVYQALEKTTQPKKVTQNGSTKLVIQIGDGLLCSKGAATSCSLLKTGQWKSFGNETYGSGDNAAFVKALYDALGVPEQKDEAFSSKVIALDRPDGNGGTERNQLACTRPTPEGEKLGLRATCEVINAL